MLSIILRLIVALLVGFAGGWLLAGGVTTLIGKGARLIAQAKPILGDASSSLGAGLPGPIVSVIAGVILIGWALRLVERAFDWLTPVGSQVTMAQPARASATPSVVQPLPIVPVEPFASDEAAQRAWNDGLRLADEGRSATAAAIFRRLAEDRWSGAAAVLASLYDTGGPDLARDPAEARQWYEVAIAEPDSDAAKAEFGMFLILESRSSSEGDRSADIARAFDLLWEAGRAGIGEAFAGLGSLYLFGLASARPAISPDLDQAVKVVEEARQRGLLLADFLDARILGLRSGRLAGFWPTIRSIFRARKIARANPDDPRLAGLVTFLCVCTGKERSDAEAMLGLSKKS